MEKKVSGKFTPGLTQPPLTVSGALVAERQTSPSCVQSIVGVLDGCELGSPDTEGIIDGCELGSPDTEGIIDGCELGSPDTEGSVDG